MGRAPDLRHTAFASLAADLERELRALGAWQDRTTQPPPALGAFGAPELSFTQWLQHVLHPRLLAIAAGTEEPPVESNVSAIGVREVDGYRGTDELIATLLEIDRLIEDSTPTQPEATSS